MALFSTGEVCKKLGITQEKLFYLERVGKIPPAERLGNGKRVFRNHHLWRLRRHLAKLEQGR